jgi:hypothetical protein
MGYTLADLEMATRHVVEGEALIREMQRHLAKRIERGQDTALSEWLIDCRASGLARCAPPAASSAPTRGRTGEHKPKGRA